MGAVIPPKNNGFKSRIFALERDWSFEMKKYCRALFSPEEMQILASQNSVNQKTPKNS